MHKLTGLLRIGASLYKIRINLAPRLSKAIVLRDYKCKDVLTAYVYIVYVVDIYRAN